MMWYFLIFLIDVDRDWNFNDYIFFNVDRNFFDDGLDLFDFVLVEGWYNILISLNFYPEMFKLV